MIGLDTSMAGMFVTFMNVFYYIIRLASAMCVNRTTEMIICAVVFFCTYSWEWFTVELPVHDPWDKPLGKNIIPYTICQLLLAVICTHKWKHVINR